MPTKKVTKKRTTSKKNVRKVTKKKSSSKKPSKKVQEHFRVAIFGSARIQKNDPRYKLVYNLAKKIAKEDIDVVTGGGPGLMDAASQGHHKGQNGNGTHSIGLTIKLPHEQRDAYHLDIKEEFKKFSGRLDKFMQLSNAVIVAPGGIGTMLEFLYTWQLIQVEQICHIPIILLGDDWEGLVKWTRRRLLSKKLVSKHDYDSIYHAPTITQAMKIIKAAKKEFEELGDAYCLNARRYV